MLTKLEISGFKTFNGFAVELAPFTVIAGPNGSGKSNLFDAIQLLGRMAETDLQSAFFDQRGEARELFTLHPDGSFATQIRLAVELLLDRRVRDKFGTVVELKYTRLRYEVLVQRTVGAKGFDRLTVAEEKLSPIPKASDTWFERYVPAADTQRWRPSTHGGARPFIETLPSESGPAAVINMRQDGGRGGRPSPASETEQTVLSSVSKADFPHVFAAKQEMLSWRFLQLNPVELRKPSSLLARDVVAVDGSNLPTALARMNDADPGVLRQLSREVNRLLPGIKKLELDHDEPRQQYVLYALMTDGRRFSSRVLSEGTLRLLALCAFKYDPQYNEVLCFEEPENGIHPYRLRAMMLLLRDLSTDFAHPTNYVAAEAPLRQLLVNTHSPGLLAALVALADDKKEAPFTALFASLATRVAPGQSPVQGTTMHPIHFGAEQLPLFEAGDGLKTYSLHEVVRYLQSEDVQDAVLSLQKQLPGTT